MRIISAIMELVHVAMVTTLEIHSISTALYIYGLFAHYWPTKKLVTFEKKNLNISN